jgi:hypothetical protein
VMAGIDLCAKIFVQLILLVLAHQSGKNFEKYFYGAGLDVMITISRDFLPIFSEKIAFFLKSKCYDSNFTKISCT